MKDCCAHPPARQCIAMTKPQDSQAGSIARPHELRLHPRRKLSGMAYVELAQDNGGILLNLSEGGFAIQSALALSSREFPDLRFQLPNMRGWLTGSGRVVWLSESKKEAGIQFLDLHEHARAQIHMWVGKDGLGEPETPASAARNGSPDAVGPETSRAEPLHASQTVLGSRSTGAERASASAQSYGAAPMRHGGPTPVEDDRSFRFNDYSMFAADANGSVTWAEPVRHKRGWGSYILFTILLAALFFVLGAMIGRDNLNGLVSSSLDGWRRIQGEAPPSTKAPAPPAATESSTPSGTESQSSATPSTPSGNGNDAASGTTQGAANNGTTAAPPTPGNTANAAAPPTVASEPQGAAGTANAEPSPQEQSAGNTPASSAVAASSNTPPSAATKPSGDSGVSKARERHAIAPKNATPPRRETAYANADAAGSNDYGRSILVNAPAPGSPPFFFHLPGEPVSASPSVAISARRSIQVPPRAYEGGYGTERMVVGKLIAHSDPFYPPEARAQHIEGIVELHALVGRSGEVLSVTPVSGPGVLAAAGVTALHEWRYEPTFINGDPVETQVDVTMVFRSR